MKTFALFFSFIFCIYINNINSQNSLSSKEIFLIDSLENVYFNSIKEYKDTFKIKKVELYETRKTIKKMIDNTIRNLSQEDLISFKNYFDSIDLKLIDAALEQNIDLCLEYMFKGGISPKLIDLRRICLYLLDFSENPALYKEIYYASGKKSFFIYKSLKQKSGYMPLQGLTKEEQSLAIWSLLKAYQVGDNDLINLASFFEKGLYCFPENKELAKKLKK